MAGNQAYLFLIFVLNGLLIGLLFDFFRILRRVFKTKDFFTYLEDILFWILTGFIILSSIFIFNNGELRLFMFLAIIIGAIIYMLFLSSYVIKINIKIFNILKRIMKIIFLPLQSVYQLLHKIFLKPFHFVCINIRKSFTNFFILIYNNIKKVKKEKNIVKN